MKVVAIIEAGRPGIDQVILWDDGERLIAYSYDQGRITKTRPLASTDITPAVHETLQAFQINDAQLTRVHEHPEALTHRIQHRQPLGGRWQ